MISIAIVEDTEKWVSIAEAYIKKIDSCAVTVKAANGLEFVDWCYHHHHLPDIALVDIEMPKMDGVQLTDFLTEQFPSIKVIAMSSYCEQLNVEEMMACGAYGYVSKLFNMKNLTLAINSVINNIIYIDPVLKIADIDRNSLMAARKKEKQLLYNSNFTPKQMALIALYATSASQKEIAEAFSVSQKTIETRISDVARKLKFGNRQDFTLQSLRKGFIRVAHISKKHDKQH
jgi:DNA-binding NarL/FixJ family response regulator